MYPPAPPPYPPRRSLPVLVPHLIWEVVLAVVMVVVVAVAAAQTSMFSGDGTWWALAFYGLLATGFALSLRTATPNLAVVGIAGGSGAGYAWLVVDAELPPLVAALVVLLGAVVVGAGLGVVTGLTSAPAWAVSLVGLAAAQALAVAVLGPGGTAVTEPLPGPLDSPAGWLVGFLVSSLAGGAVLAVPSVRRLLSAARTADDPVRFGGARLVGALVGFVGSSVLGSLAGLALVMQLGVSFGGVVDMFSLLLVLGAVLVGGVSVFGGRGGIAGTVLGVGLLTVTVRWLDFEQPADGGWSRWLVVGFAILVGVGLGRLIEAIAPVTPPPLAIPPPPPARALPAPAPAPTVAEPAQPDQPGTPPRAG